MAIQRDHIQDLIGKLEALPPERLEEIEDFIDFLEQRNLDRRLTQSATQTAEQSFSRIWDNPDDAIYDQL
ncbi:MAG TPA: DUF2281 domain-containing protein [Gammaproteobacteria bacterium]|nr:DUF2281 domain-containing protein [Gammaproteobacteria bacterium]